MTEQQYRESLQEIRRIGAKSGTDLNAINRIFDVVDRALRIERQVPSTDEDTEQWRREQDARLARMRALDGGGKPSLPTREQIAEASAEALRDVAYVCGRVWEAWQVGTMSEDDFAPAWEDDELTGSIADAVLALLQNGADR